MKIDTPHRLHPLRKKNRYFNSHDDHIESLIFQTIPSFILSLYGRKKRQSENKSEWVAHETPLVVSHEPVITWIGHATFLIQVGGLNILTDPIFGSASAFFRRLLPPGIPLAQLPPIDIVLLSHNHRDHCDLPSLYALQKAYPHLRILAAEGDKKWLNQKGLRFVDEFAWWQTYAQNGVECTFLPAHHWSAQGIFDRNRSLWGSWMICHKGHSIYFAGDTSYSTHFARIAHEFTKIDVALMPIAPELPHPAMRKSHIDSHEAVQAFIDLKAQTFVPMHWGTFPFGTDTFLGPIQRLQTNWNAHQFDGHKNLIIPKVGQRIMLR